MARNMTDYATTRREFSLSVPERFNWAFDVFDTWARDPGKLALLWVASDGQPRRFSFAELGERSRRVRQRLRGAGGDGGGARIRHAAAHVPVVGNHAGLPARARFPCPAPRC